MEARKPESKANLEHTGPGDSAGLGHERRDIRIFGVLWFAAGMVIAAIVIHLALWGLFDFLDRQALATDPEPNPMIKRDVADKVMLPQDRLRKVTRGFPEPRLQYDDVADMKALRRVESEKLGLNGQNSYAWINQADGIVRIPLDRAMELVAQRGLPAVAPGGGSPAAPAAPGQAEAQMKVKPGEAGQIGLDTRQSIHGVAAQEKHQ